MLYVLGLPIGNLGDITLRGIEYLKKADYVFVEDPRVFSKLMKLLEIKNKHEIINIIHNHKINTRKIHKILELLYNNQNKVIKSNQYTEKIALIVSDSGTPTISDPGREVVNIAHEIGLKCYSLPGPAASISAVALSGFVFKEYTFLGFLPIKKGRQTAWQNIQKSQFPVVLYESCHRIHKFIQELKEYLPQEVLVSISHDLTKLHEFTRVENVSDIDPNEYSEKGEYVIVIGMGLKVNKK